MKKQKKKLALQRETLTDLQWVVGGTTVSVTIGTTSTIIVSIGGGGPVSQNDTVIRQDLT